MLLSAILVVPFFVNWTDHKAAFEREASVLLGHEVRVKGAADAQILPIPTFTFDEIEVGAKAGAPLMSAARIKVRVELLPLLQRRIEVIDMVLEAPQVTVDVAKDGTTNWTQIAREARLTNDFEVKLGPVTVKDGRIFGRDRGSEKSLTFSKVNATITAQSLQGPWKSEGDAVAGDEPFSFKLATGKIEGRKIRTKTTILPANLKADLFLDGVLDLAASEKAPNYTGSLKARKRMAEVVDQDGKKKKDPARPWELLGQFEVDRSKFLLTQALFEDGAREAPVSLNGSVRIPFSGAMRFDAVLSSRQIDLDRAYGKALKQPLAVSEAQSVLASILSSLPAPPLPGTLSVDVPGIVVGGDVIRSVRFDAIPVENGWKVEDLGAVFPGNSRVSFNGIVKTKGAMQVDGAVEVVSDRLASLAKWWQPDDADRLKIAVRDFRLKGKISGEPNALRLTDMDMAVGNSDLAGSLSFAAISDRQKRFEGNLRAKRLDFDALRSLAAFFVGENNVSGIQMNDTLTLKLTANTLIAEQLEGKNADINLRIANGEVDITTLKIADFAGAEIDLAGSVRDMLTKPAGRFRGTVKADQTEGLIKIVEAVAPTSAILPYLRNHGQELLPLDVSVIFSGDQREGGDSDVAATLTGKVGAGDMKAGLRFEGDWDKFEDGEISASLVADYVDSAQMLKQFAWPVVPTISKDPAKIDLTARGTLKTGIAATLALDLAGAKISSDTTVSKKLGEDVAYRAGMTVRSANAETLITALGFTVPGIGLGTSANLSLTVSGKGYDGVVKDVAGAIGDGPIKADLAFKGVPLSSEKAWKWTGSVETDRISLPWLTAIGTGALVTPLDGSISPETVGEAGNVTEASSVILDPSLWSKANFNKPYFERFHADVKVKTKAVDLVGDEEVSATSFAFRLRDRNLSFNDIEGRFKGGALTGSLTFDNNDNAVTARALLSLKGANANDLLWADGERALIEGKLDFSAQVEGTGRSVKALVENLGGGGSVILNEGRLRRINPATFGLVIEASDKDVAIEGDVLEPVIAGFLDAGSLSFQKAEGAFTVTSGVMRMANVRLPGDKVTTLGNLTLDLPAMTLKGNMSISVAAKDIDEQPVQGSTPEIGVLFEGPVSKPARTLDLQPLLGYLTVRRFEKEVKRTEELQADILEKQRLSRYVRWIEHEIARERRETLEAEEAARRAAEEKKRAEEAAKRRAERQAQEARAQRRARDQARRAAEAARKARQNIIVIPAPDVQPLDLVPRSLQNQ